MRLRLVIALGLCGAPTSTPGFAADIAACHQALTFRWTSGEPIRLGIVHPPPEAMRNPPFLMDPRIASVTVGRGRFGAKLTMKLEADAAAVLTHETAAHHRAQMLVMLGGDVLISAIVMGPLGADVVLDGHPEDELSELAQRLRSRSAPGGSCLTIAAGSSSGKRHCA